MKPNATFKIDIAFEHLSPLRVKNKKLAAVTRLYEEVVKTLISQWEIPSDTITIKEHNGWITLDGVVPWNFQRNAANAAIQEIPAVKGVTNNLYTLSQERDDKDKVLLEAAFLNSTILRNLKIQVSVTDREITLNGSVPTDMEKNEAERISWTIPGIWIVNNEITKAK